MLSIENVSPKEGSPIRVVLGRALSFSFNQRSRPPSGASKTGVPAPLPGAPVRIMNFEWPELKKVVIRIDTESETPPDPWILFEVSSWDFTMQATSDDVDALMGWFEENRPTTEVDVIHETTE